MLDLLHVETFAQVVHTVCGVYANKHFPLTRPPSFNPSRLKLQSFIKDRGLTFELLLGFEGMKEGKQNVCFLFMVLHNFTKQSLAESSRLDA